MTSFGKRRGRRSVAGATRTGFLAALLILTGGLAAAPIRAEPAPLPIPLTQQDQADLQRIAAYLGGITTMYARFYQYSANGGTASGQVWMERPGRMRFEYNP